MATDETPAVIGAPLVLLRLEGLGLFALAIVLYSHSGAAWWLFPVLFLVPDVSFAGYLGGPRIGAVVYNAAHTTLGPIVLAGFGVSLGQALPITLALVWAAHIGFDRMLGYGLKYAAGFGSTHLGRIGRGIPLPPREIAAGKG
jgi:hypothetical protein